VIGIKDKSAAKRNDKVLAKRLEEARQLGKPKAGPMFEFDLWKEKRMDGETSSQGSTMNLSSNNSQTPTGSDTTAVYAYPLMQSQPFTPTQQLHHHRWDLSPSTPDSSMTVTFKQLEDAVYGSSGDSLNYEKIRADFGYERSKDREGGGHEPSRSSRGGRKGGEHAMTSSSNTEREGRSRTRQRNSGVGASRGDTEMELFEGGGGGGGGGSSKRSQRGMGSFDGGALKVLASPSGPPRLARAESEIVYGPSSRRKAMGVSRHHNSSHRRRSTPGNLGVGDQDGHGGEKLTGFAALFGASHRRCLSPERGTDRARSWSPTWHQTNRREDVVPCRNQGGASVVSFAEGPPR